MTSTVFGTAPAAAGQRPPVRFPRNLQVTSVHAGRVFPGQTDPQIPIFQDGERFSKFPTSSRQVFVQDAGSGDEIPDQNMIAIEIDRNRDIPLRNHSAAVDDPLMSRRRRVSRPAIAAFGPSPGFDMFGIVNVIIIEIILAIRCAIPVFLQPRPRFNGCSIYVMFPFSFRESMIPLHRSPHRLRRHLDVGVGLTENAA
jgi:hypothetical protein